MTGWITRTSPNTAPAAAKLLLLLLFLSFALNNSEVIVLRYFFGWQQHMPLAVALFASFVLGGLIGMLALGPRLWRMHRELARLRKQAHPAPSRPQP